MYMYVVMCVQHIDIRLGEVPLFSGSYELDSSDDPMEEELPMEEEELQEDSDVIVEHRFVFSDLHLVFFDSSAGCRRVCRIDQIEFYRYIQTPVRIPLVDRLDW